MSKGFPALEIEEVSTIEEEQTKHLLVNEDSVDYLKKVDLIDAICQAPDKAARRDAIAHKTQLFYSNGASAWVKTAKEEVIYFCN